MSSFALRFWSLSAWRIYSYFPEKIALGHCKGLLLKEKAKHSKTAHNVSLEDSLSLRQTLKLN